MVVIELVLVRSSGTGSAFRPRSPAPWMGRVVIEHEYTG